jgi:hypothetical protein
MPKNKGKGGKNRVRIITDKKQPVAAFLLPPPLLPTPHLQFSVSIIPLLTQKTA